MTIIFDFPSIASACKRGGETITGDPIEMHGKDETVKPSPPRLDDSPFHMRMYGPHGLEQE